MPRTTSFTTALLLLSIGCSVQSGAIAPVSDGGMDADADADTGTFDSDLPDGWVPDTMIDVGPPCTEFSEPHVLAVIAGVALLRTMGVVYDGTEIEEPGNVTLRVNRYRYGAWAVDGHEDVLLLDPPNLSDLAASAATARAFRSDPNETVGVGEAPYDLLIALDDLYTIELAGEIRLSAGDNILHVTVENRAIFAVDVDGTSMAIQLANTGEASMTVAAPRDDWYPVHGAWQNSGGDGAFRVDITPPGESQRDVEPSEMRVDAAARSGREVFGWTNQSLDGDPSGSRIDENETTWTGDGPYPGVGNPDRDDWSARWSGRYLFADPIHDLLVTSDDSHRLFVDGVFHGRDYSRSARVRYDTQAADGIIDVVLELSESRGGSEMTVMFDDEVFQPDQLRPYTRFGGAPYGVGEEIDDSISSSQTRTLDLSMIPGGPPSAVEVSVVIEASDPSAVMVTVLEPGGLPSTEPLTNAAWSRQAGLWLLRWVPPWADSLDGADGEWQLTVDNTGPDSVRWQRQGVLAHLGGIAEPYPRSGSFRTAFIDLGDESQITGVRAGGVVNGQTSLSYAIRAGATPAEVVTLPFTDTNAEGDLPAPTTGRFLQVEARLVGPGWDTPRIRDLRIIGRACRRCVEVGEATCPEQRVADDLIALWAFEEGSGGFVRDLSGYRVHDLIVETGSTFAWESGYVTINNALLRVDRPIDEIREAIASADGLTVEAWVRPLNDTQGGPARILTISETTDTENLALGQTGNTYSGRIRRDTIGANPQPRSDPGSVVVGALQHVVLTRSPDGMAQLWVDGVASGPPEDNSGAFSAWDPDFRLYVGDENLGRREWSGELHLIAIYRRALSADEIARHQRIGPQRRPPSP